MSLESSLELQVIKEQMIAVCATTLGQNYLRDEHTSYERLVIRRRNALCKEALAAVVAHGPMPFDGLRDIRSVLEQANKGRTLTPNDLLLELHVILGIKGIQSYMKEVTTPCNDLRDLTDTLIVHEKVAQVLSSCVNEYGEIMDSASPTLRSVRSSLRRVDGEIQAAVARFVSTHASSIVDGIVTDRGGRAVVLVKASEKNTFGGMFYGDSASGQASYIEPASLVGPNNRKQELKLQEQEEIQAILRRCSALIKEIAEEEMGNLETVAVLDAYFAKAEWGKQRECIAAELSEVKELYFQKARHPLIDPKNVVSNDYHLKEPQTLLLITGPNTGGKTVSMKIIGLFTLMTYCGMPVPALQARVPFFDAVYADIGDEQSVVSSLSSFSAHIARQSEAVRNATGNSLCLLDEIGSGTDPREGESLAIAILNELRTRHTMTIATTHYSRLKAYGKRHEDILVASVEFDMEKLAPTYRYLEGVTGQSNALQVARRYGLPDSILSYASFLKDQAKTQEDQLIENLEQQLQKSREKNDRLDAKLKEIMAYQKELAQQKIALSKEQDRFHAEMEEEKEKILEEARRDADEVLKEMRAMQETARYHEVLQKKRKLEQEDSVPPEESSLSSTTFCVGDTVELKSSNTPARIVAMRKKDITILLNGREVHVKAENIRPSMKVLPKKAPAPKVKMRSNVMFESFPLECNLIGMRRDEARDEFTRYLDQAKLHKCRYFRVIHGDGSGALRAMVHEVLKKDASVENFRLGMPQEGGSGATVVTLKG